MHSPEKILAMLIVNGFYRRPSDSNSNCSGTSLQHEMYVNYVPVLQFSFSPRHSPLLIFRTTHPVPVCVL